MPNKLKLGYNFMYSELLSTFGAIAFQEYSPMSKAFFPTSLSYGDVFHNSMRNTRLENFTSLVLKIVKRIRRRLFDPADNRF